MLKLFVSITPHGYGHAAQTIPVIKAIAARHALELTIQSDLPKGFLQSRLDLPFEQIPSIADFGMTMIDPMQVDKQATLNTYQRLFSSWPEYEAMQREVMLKVKPDVVLSNVSFLSIAVAASMQIPAFAFSSLNWADIFLHSCGDLPGSPVIVSKMQDAYAVADAFVALTPAMPMSWLPRAQCISPVIEQEHFDRQPIILGGNDISKWLLVAFGGIPYDIDTNKWQVEPGWGVLVPPQLADTKRNIFSVDNFPGSFCDLLASVDLVLSKPGYGTFVNAAYCDANLAYVPRASWPESECLQQWLARHGRACPVQADFLETGRFTETYLALKSLPVPTPFSHHGAEEMADLVLGKLPDLG